MFWPRTRRMRWPKQKRCCLICLRTTSRRRLCMKVLRLLWELVPRPGTVPPPWPIPVPFWFFPEGSACVTAFGQVDGMACGLVTLTGDSVCGCTASRVARFVRLCDAFSLPVLTFVDAAGFQGIKGAAKLSQAYTEATTAKNQCDHRSGLRPGLIAVAGKLAGADAVLAWPQAVISPLAPGNRGPDSVAGPPGRHAGSHGRPGGPGGGRKTPLKRVPPQSGGRRVSTDVVAPGRNQGENCDAAGNARWETGFPSAQETFEHPVIRQTDARPIIIEFNKKKGMIEYETLSNHGQRQRVRCSGRGNGRRRGFCAGRCSGSVCPCPLWRHPHLLPLRHLVAAPAPAAPSRLGPRPLMPPCLATSSM